MGIKDLMRWVKKHYPQVVTEYPKRWASKELRGKSVAIDATLLTNRFHFAENDVNVRGARGILGWYSMIREMQVHGVRPIAVWDERGDRPWKAPEARRRLETRARYLARLGHEDRRRARISRLRDELKYYGAMTAREHAVVAACWDLGRFLPDDSPHPTSFPSLSSSAHAVSPLESHRALATVVALGNLASRIASLSELYEAHLIDSKPIVRPHTSEHPTADAFEEEEEEVRRIALGLDSYPDSEPSSPSGSPSHAAISTVAELLENDEGAALLDARLKQLPLAEYTESPKQRSLTDLEAEVYELAFATDGEDPFALEVNGRARSLEALRNIGYIESGMPSVRGIYTRALAIPREEHHAACRELLTRMGVPIVFARVPYEAEGLCSAMALSGVVDFAGTEDSDVVAYGGPLLRNLSTARYPLLLVDGASLSSQMPLSTEAWLDFCILLGTDASPRIHKVGPTNAYKLINTWGSIEAILENNPSLAERVDPDFMEQIANARWLFTDLPRVEAIHEVEGQSDDDVVAWMKEMGAIVSPAQWGGRDEQSDKAEYRGPVVSNTEGWLADNGDFGAQLWTTESSRGVAGVMGTVSERDAVAEVGDIPREKVGRAMEGPPRLEVWDETWERA